MFRRNYLYELPDDIQATIYRIVFSRCIRDLENDRGIKYIYRLYGAVNNPQNTCVYSIIPKGMFTIEDEERQAYKYKRIADLEDYGKIMRRDRGKLKDLKNLIYLDRKNLLNNKSHYQSNKISFYIYPLFTTDKLFRKYLSSLFNLLGYYDNNLIVNIKVVDDRIDIVFTRHFKCNADIYYNILVGYNVLYNSLSNIIYNEEYGGGDGILFIKFVEMFRWLEANNILEGYNIYNNKIIPMFEGKIGKK